MSFKYLFIPVLLLSSFLRGFHHNIKNYSIEEGLAQSQVYSLCQAKNGFLWIGTLGGGVSRFDGITFTNFTTTDGLSNNQVLSIFEDSNQDLWFGTEAGACRFDGEKFQPLTAGKDLHDTPGSDAILSMRLDCKGHIWFGTAENGLFKYDGSTVSHFSTADGLVHNTVHSIFEDSKGTLWFGTSGGVGRFDGKTSRDFTRENGLSDNVVKAILEDRGGNLWFGTNTAGIFIFDGKGFTTLTEKNGLSSNVVWALLEDREGNIWFGGLKGAIKYNPRPEKPNVIEPVTHITGLRFLFDGDTPRQYAGDISSKSGLPVDLRLPYDKNFLVFDYIGLSFTAPQKVKYRYRLEGFDNEWLPVTGSTYANYSNLPPGKYTFKVKACNNDGIWNGCMVA